MDAFSDAVSMIYARNHMINGGWSKTSTIERSRPSLPSIMQIKLLNLNISDGNGVGLGLG